MYKAGYQPGVDGLRAIAVVSVLLFHLQIETFSGGYVGVDVFFVISGFLITRLILNEMHNTGTFRFTNFYLRRVKRLFPALVATLIVSLIAGYMLLIPEHMERLGSSFIAAIFSVSNIYFWSGAGYFDVNSEFKPLLHTWSLSVEEQFYFIWPAVIYLAAKFTNARTMWIVLGLGIISFLMNLAFADGKVPWLETIWPRAGETFLDGQSTIFYLTPFRVFEFAIGALTVWVAQFRFKKELFNEIGLLVGLGLILYPIFTYTEKTLFPSYNALMPCIGTAICIIFQYARFSNRLISNPVMVKLGLLSYSIYLVHWPLIIYYQYFIFDEINVLEQIILIVLSIALAQILHSTIEKPFRNGSFSFPNLRPAIYFSGAIALAATLSIPAYSAWTGNGWPSRFTPLYSGEAAKLETAAKASAETFCKIEATFQGDCDMDRKNRILLLGDSHLPAWKYALSEIVENENTEIFMLSYLGCHADFKVSKEGVTSAITKDNCKAKAQFLTENTEFLASLDTVLLTSYRPFSYQANRFRFDLLDYVRTKNADANILIAGNYVQTDRRKPCSMVMLRTGERSSCTSEKFVDYIGNRKQIETEPLFSSEIVEKFPYVDFAAKVCPEARNCPFEASWCSDHA